MSMGSSSLCTQHISLPQEGLGLQCPHSPASDSKLPSSNWPLHQALMGQAQALPEALGHPSKWQ